MLEQYLPLNVLSAEKGVGSFVIIDLLESITGKIYRLWIYLCYWDLVSSNEDVLLSASDENANEFKKQLESLKGHVLVKIIESIEDDDTVIRLIFDNETYIELYSDLNYSTADNFFMFYMPECEDVWAYSLQNGLYLTK